MCVCVSVKTDIKIDNHYNKEFLAGGGGGVGRGLLIIIAKEEVRISTNQSFSK